MKLNYLFFSIFLLLFSSCDNKNNLDSNDSKQGDFQVLFTNSSGLFGVAQNTLIELVRPHLPLGVSNDQISEELIKSEYLLISANGNEIEFSVEILDRGSRAILKPLEQLKPNDLYKIRTKSEASGLKSTSLPDSTVLDTNFVNDPNRDWDNINWSADTLFRVANWTPTYFPELDPQVILAIDFATENVGFVVGAGGLCLKTMDQGETWNKIDLGIDRTLYNVKFFNDKLGFIVGSDMTLFKTTDGGEQWILVESVQSGDHHFFRDIDMYEDFLVIVGSGGVWYSHDSGETWGGTSLTKTLATRAVEVLDESNVIVGSDFGTISKGATVTYSEDSKSFRMTEDNQLVEDDYNLFMFEGFKFLDKTTGFTVGSNAYKHAENQSWSCCRDFDGDGTYTDTLFFWAAINSSSFIDYRNGSQLPDNSEFTIFKTNDGAKSWDLKANGFGIVKNIDFPSDMIGYASGFEKHSNGTINQMILNSKDGGESWNRCDYMGRGFLYDVKFLNDSIGFVVGYDINPTDSLSREYPVIFKTTNGGGFLK